MKYRKKLLMILLAVVATILAPRETCASILMGQWDTDGDGVLEDVYNDVTSIRVQKSSGSFRSYQVGSNWALSKVVDTDGVQGLEIVVNIGGSVRIICDRIGTFRDYGIGPNWRLVTATDTDGRPGAELVFNIGVSVRIVHDASGVVQNYFVAGNWVFLVAADTDGLAGNELVFNVLGRPRIIHDATGTTSDYSLIAQNWVFMGAAETDGKPGDELLFNLGTTVRIFHEASGGTMTDRFVAGSWALMDIVDTDGCAGEELVFNAGGTVLIISDADGRSRSYAVPLPWTYLGATQVDGLPGLELQFNTFGNILVTIRDGSCRPGVLQFGAASSSLSENATDVVVTVRRGDGSAGAVSVSYSTSDGSATVGSDYTAASGTLVWPDGDASDRTISISIVNDGLAEPAETFTVTLSNPTGGATLGSPVTALLTIDDADSDGDSIPDDWETTYGLNSNDQSDGPLDADGDGFTNFEEFLLGTNPQGATSNFGITNTQANGADVQISLNSVTGKSYRVECTGVSPAGPWTTITNVVGNGGTLQVTDIGGAVQAKRFYRVVLLP